MSATSIDNEYDYTYEHLWDIYERWQDGDGVDETVTVEDVRVRFEAPSYDPDMDSPGIELYLPDRFDQSAARERNISNKWEFEARIRSLVREMVHGTDPRPR